MLGIGHAEPGAVLQIRLLVDDDHPLRPILFQPHHLGEDPVVLLLPVAAFDGQGAKTLWMLYASLRRHRVNALPVPAPVDVARTLDLAHPMLATTFNPAGQVDGQDASIKGVVRLREMPLGLSLPDDLDDELRPFPIGPSMQLMVEQLQ
jgi:hypothetical protein